MSKKIFVLLDEVEQFLNDHKVLRDSDERLMANIWAKYIGIDSVKFLDATDILKMLSKGELPSYESISRCRRKLQEEFPNLRGDKWEHRQAVIKKKVKKEIQSFPSVRKKMEKAKLERMQIKTPYPVGFEYKKER